MTETIKLPTNKVQITRVNPKRLVVYSKPKTGKTTAFAGLDGNLLIDLEDGSDYVEAFKMKAKTLEELKKIGEEIKKQGCPYKFVTIDTVTVLEDIVKPLALKIYCNTPRLMGLIIAILYANFLNFWKIL